MAARPHGPSPIDRYLQRLSVERGYSPRTIDGYRRELSTLATLAGGRDWSAIEAADARRWSAQAARSGLAPASIARRLSAWRGFFDWLAGQGLVAANPVLGVRAPKRARRLPKALAPDLAMRLVDYDPADGSGPPGEAFERIRDKALVELFYSSGLRLSELTGLDAAYVEADGHRSKGWLARSESEVLVTGKGGKRRAVPVGSKALEALDVWCAIRVAWLAVNPQAERHALFITRRGTRLSNRAVQARLRQLAIERGIPANVHPHVLRHSFASHLLQSSGDLRAVQELLGHASIATTQVYTSLDFQRLAAVYDAAHPRARGKR
jgi:integrase/recombinase XerC